MLVRASKRYLTLAKSKNKIKIKTQSIKVKDLEVEKKSLNFIKKLGKFKSKQMQSFECNLSSN